MQPNYEKITTLASISVKFCINMLKSFKLCPLFKKPRLFIVVKFSTYGQVKFISFLPDRIPIYDLFKTKCTFRSPAI